MDRLINENAVLSAIGEWIAHNEHTYTNATEYLRNRVKAIKTAEKEPTAKENLVVEDAISRQAVLDGIEELKKSPWATDKRGIGFEYLITEALEVVADLCVKREPSVTPKPKTDVLDKIRAEIEQYEADCRLQGGTDECEKCNSNVFGSVYRIIDKYKAESEDKE